MLLGLVLEQEWHLARQRWSFHDFTIPRVVLTILAWRLDCGRDRGWCRALPPFPAAMLLTHHACTGENGNVKEVV